MTPDDPRTPPGQPRGRSGSEPVTARTPLRLRLILALGGGAFCLVLAVGLLTLADREGWMTGLGIALAAGALVAAVDTAVVLRRMRAARRGR